MKGRMIALPLTALCLAIVACGDSTGPAGATRNVRLTFQSMVTPAGASQNIASLSAQALFGAPNFATSHMSGDTLVVVNGTDTLKITQVKLTLAELELEREDETVDCELPENDEHEDCEDFEAGPFFVELALGGGPHQFSVPATFGTYDTLEFEFDVADEDDAAHVAYRAAHPEMANASIRVIGLYNGTPFDFALDIEVEKEVALTMPLVVSGGFTSFEVDIQFDVASWFVRTDGSLIDPNSVCALPTGCADREIIEDNVENQIESHSDDSDDD